MDIGIYTFADVAPGGSHPQRLRELVAEMELADQVGLDVFGLGNIIARTMPCRRLPWLLRRVRRAPGISASPVPSPC